MFNKQTLKLEADRKDLITQLNNFRLLILAGKMSDLQRDFIFNYNKNDGRDEEKSLKEVLNKIDLDDINYYKNIGLSRVSVDNGFVHIRCQFMWTEIW